MVTLPGVAAGVDAARSVLVTQIGARRHYAVPQAFHQAGLLDRLVTDACSGAAPWRQVRKLLPAALQKGLVRRLLDRQAPEIPPGRIVNLTSFFLSGAAGSGRQRPSEHRVSFWIRRNADFARRAARCIGRDTAAVYGFNGAALELFEIARSRGLACILDQTAAPWRHNTRMLQEEARHWPGWDQHGEELDLTGELGAREEREWSMADAIVCGSPYVVETMRAQKGPVDPCCVVPYGFDAPRQAARSDRPERNGGLNCLFVGTLQLRKGLPYLLQAEQMLQNSSIRFRLVGPAAVSEQALAQLRERMEWVGAVPRSAVAEHYAWADVLVFPTLSEGSANVCYEAMAAGVPVITTPNAGSVVRDGLEGIIVPCRDAQALAAAIERLATDGVLRREMGENARRRSRDFSWAAYHRRLVEQVQDRLSLSQSKSRSVATLTPDAGVPG